MWIFITIIITWLLLLPWIMSPIRPLTYLSWLHLWTSEQPGKDCNPLLCSWFNHKPPSCSPGIVGKRQCVSLSQLQTPLRRENFPLELRTPVGEFNFPPKSGTSLHTIRQGSIAKKGIRTEAELRFSAGRSLTTSLWCVLIEFPGAQDLNGL